MDARITFAPNTTTDHLASRLDQPHIIDLTPHPTIRNMSNAASTSSLLDYRSPTVGSITPPPEEVADDPWSATAEKLDNTLKGTKLVVERPPPDDDVVPDVSSSLNSSSLNGLTSASSIAERAARRAASEAPSESPEWMKDLDRIKVTIAPEKAGILMFKHVNYILESQNRRIAVLRRYSDFIWLVDILQRRYPFRMLPGLPPKRMGADEAFLERRRRGLARFINSVANHPVLREDECVIAFLTVEMDIHAYRKSKPLSTDEETRATLNGREVPAIPEDLDERITRFRASLSDLIVQYRDLSILMERIARRTDGSALDFLRYHAVLNKMTETPDCPRSDCGNCTTMNTTTGQIAGGFQRVGRIMEEQAQMNFDGALEGLKAHRNLLASCHDMFTRRDRALAQITIDSLLKRIESNETKLRELRAKDPPAKELDRLKGLVEQDRAEVKAQQERIELIRSCLWQELLYYHRQKAFVSLLYQGYISEQIRFATQFAEVWKTLATPVFELPTVGFA
ncbi:Sorting nexin mvp1 [Rhizophlyctis rosea]|uniref:Sorting nexin MVP1 n=1 Tax=Rhizophlyctis rosea TaxID=64517 RepID=A0AAD5S756_9FUNG|nr:Sorting nexin mvp1 [Rhizophlyctis rosea]